MKTDSIDSAEPETASPQNIERWMKACNQLILFIVVMAVACGLGLYQAGHLELPITSSGQSSPPPVDRGGKVGPLDNELDGIRQKNWWWMQWLE
jgi:hypothetical protein